MRTSGGASGAAGVLGPCAGGAGSQRRDAGERHAAGDRQQRRHRERRAPSGVLDEQARGDRRERHAEISGQAVDADREARSRRAAHEHRDPDRVIDRRERAHQREGGRELPRIARDGDQQRRGAHAEEEDEHHPPPSPEVAQAARRQRAQAEQHERADAVGHQRFPVGETEIGGDRRDRRREDQQEHVVDRVRDVEQQRNGAGGDARGPPRLRLAPRAAPRGRDSRLGRPGALIVDSRGKPLQLREERFRNIDAAPIALAASARRRSPGRRTPGSSDISAISASIRAR